MDDFAKDPVSKPDNLLPGEKGKREAEDGDDKESVKVKKQRVEEDFTGIKNDAVGTLSEEDNSFESEQQIEPSTAKNGHLDSDWKDERNGLGENKSVLEGTLAVAGVLMASSNSRSQDVASKKEAETIYGSDSSCKDDTHSAGDLAATEQALEAPTGPAQLTSEVKKKESNGDSDSKEESAFEGGVADMPKVLATETEKPMVAVILEKDKSRGNGSDSEEQVSAEDVYEVNLASMAQMQDALVTAAFDKKDDCNDGSIDSTNEDKEPHVTNIESLLLGTTNVNSSSQAAGQDSGCSDESVASDRQGLFGLQTASENRSPVEYSEDDDDSLEDEEDSDVEMADVLKPEGCAGDVGSLLENTPKSPTVIKEQIIDPKTVFVGNLSFSVEREDVENFLQTAGEIVDIRFAMNPDETFRGYGYAEFASAEAAEKAIRELNGKELLRRRVKIGVARRRVHGTIPCASGENMESLQKGETTQRHSVFVRGFNKYNHVYQIRASLEHHFGSCGEIERVSIPRYPEGGAKGIAYVDFKDQDAAKQALELNGSECEGSMLSVEEARPRGDGSDIAGGFRGGGWLGGRNGGRGFGGRFCGNWAFGGGWGRGPYGGEGRWRGTPRGPYTGNYSYRGGWDHRGEGRGRGPLTGPRMGSSYTFDCGWDHGRGGRGYRTSVEPRVHTWGFRGGWDRRGGGRGHRAPREPYMGGWASGYSWHHRIQGRGRIMLGEPSTPSSAVGGSWDHAGEVKEHGMPGEPSIHSRALDSGSEEVEEHGTPSEPGIINSQALGTSSEEAKEHGTPSELSVAAAETGSNATLS